MTYKYSTSDIICDPQKIGLSNKLYYACQKCTNGNFDSIKALLNQGANINYATHSGIGCTTLIQAIKDNNFTIVKLLLDLGADIDTTCRYDFMAPILYALFNILHSDLKNSDLTITLLLLERGADVNARDRYNWTPLMHVRNRKTRHDYDHKNPSILNELEKQFFKHGATK